MVLEQKPLGRTGRTISAVGLGCVTFGREIDEETAYRIMDYAVDNGITFFDTAEVYGGGQARRYRKEAFGTEDEREASGEMSSSERIVGRWMSSRGCRDDVTLCSKVISGGDADSISRALDGSLERLGTDHVDIYKMHEPDPDTPIAETMAAMTAEADAGRIGVVGGSNYSAAELREVLDASAAGGYRRFEIVQPPYSLALPDAEEELFPMCAREEIAVTPFSPLGAGFLTGKYNPDRSTIPLTTRFGVMPFHIDMYFTDRNFRTVDRLREKASELGLPMVQLAVGWAMTHPAVTSVIVGARTTEHIDNALRAYEFGLDPALREEMSGWTRA